MSNQIPFVFGLIEQNTFDYFQPGENLELVHFLKNLDLQTFKQAYLFGVSGSGITHLLQATCHWYSSRQAACFYLPLDKVSEYTVDVLQGMESMDLCCLDGLQYIAGNEVWESALFDFYHRVKENNVKLIISGNESIQKIGLRLPDLISRVEWGSAFSVQSLNDAQIKQVLIDKAIRQESVFPELTIEYILGNYSRNLSELTRLLDLLIHAAWSEKRKLTIPFIKSIIEKKRMHYQ